MKKRYFAAAGALFIAAALFGQDAADFTYEAGNGEVTITGYTGSEKNVTIPGRINNLPVTVIGETAFAGNQLTGITIPGSVTVIGDRAFWENQLTGVTIPDSVTVIGGSAFATNQLTDVTIPDFVTVIGDWAFADNQLTGVTIPDSVTAIGNSAFADNYLTSVTIPDSLTVIEDWTSPHLVDTKISVEYNRRGENDGKERQRTAGIPEGIQSRGSRPGRET